MEKKRLTELFQICKEELKKRRSNIKYFNIEFFTNYVMYERLKILSEKDEKFIEKREAYLKEKIFTTNFYIRNSGCYCEFLSIAYDYRKDFELLLGLEEY